MSLSSITLSGTVSKDAEQRVTPNNNSVISFMLQVPSFDGRTKEEKIYPCKVNLWGDSYVDIANRIKQGERVVVSGRLQIDQFNDKSGKAVRMACIEANKLYFISDLVGADSSAIAKDFDFANSAMDLSESQEIPF